jgi:hypothetical protein
MLTLAGIVLAVAAQAGQPAWVVTAQGGATPVLMRRQDIAEQFGNAWLNCTLPEDAEARLMDGFEAAYVRLDATRK